jgi:ABC-type transport system involved in multi-copper enzyme maturation permease subunit
MLDALSAEVLKLTRHKATWFLVWLYPILFVVLFLISIAIGLAHSGAPARPVAAEAWIAQTAMIWKLPTLTIGRFLMAAYVAVVFAGEYGWNTWKLIVPHRGRSSLIAAKFAALVLLFAAALSLTAGISVLFTWIEGVVTGHPAPAGIGVGALLQAHARSALAGLAPFLFTLASIGLAAVLTRSMVAALVIGIVVTMVEQLFLNFAPLLYVYAPGLVWALFHALPGYHLSNLASWVAEGTARSDAFPGRGDVALPWMISLGVAAAWIAALTAATFAAFRRQDIN